MRKLTDEALQALLDAFDHGDYAGEHDFSRFVYGGHSVSDIRRIYKARALIIENPSVSPWDLVGVKITWDFQERYLGGLDNFKRLLGYETVGDDEPICTKQDKGRVLMALWKALSSEQFVLKAYDVPKHQFSFVNEARQLKVEVLFKPSS